MDSSSGADMVARRAFFAVIVDVRGCVGLKTVWVESLLLAAGGLWQIETAKPC